MGRELTTTGGASTALVERHMAPIRVLLRRDPQLRSYHSKRGYEHDLRQFIEWRGDVQVTKLEVEAYASYLLEQRQSPNSVNRSLAAIRWLARKMADLAFEDESMAPERREFWMHHGDRVARKVKNVRGKRAKKGREVSESEVRALLEACVADDSPAGIRDAAMIAVAWQTGPRRSELGWAPERQTAHGTKPERGLRLCDYHRLEDGNADLMIRNAKGDKDRTVPVHNGAAAYLEDWLAIRADEPGPLFYAIRKDGVLLVGQGLSGQAMGYILDKRARQAGVKALTWHDFRRTFATDELRKGTAITVVAQGLGHENISTTAGYDRSGHEAVREVARDRLVPYIRGKRA